jgi:hypothetical protein
MPSAMVSTAMRVSAGDLALLLRPLPFGRPDALVALNADLARLPLTNVGFSVPEIDDLTGDEDAHAARNLYRGTVAGAVQFRSCRDEQWNGRAG